MVPVPASAFEVYQQMKSAKKKARNKNKNKNKNKIKSSLKNNPAVIEELANSFAKKRTTNENENGLRETGDSYPQVNELPYEIIEVNRPNQNIKGEGENGESELSSSAKKSKKKKKIKAEKGETSLGPGSPKKIKLQKLDSASSSGSSKKRKSSPFPILSPTGAVSLLNLESSEKTAESWFSWLMDPIKKEDFFNLYWEKRPVHISREDHLDYYSDILSTPAIDRMLRDSNILYGKNLDITSYTNGQRTTLNSVGRAHAAVVWDYYRNGCSIRLLNPQTYHGKLREVNTWLQEIFGSFVGANAYLTPPNSQGFAPHYDDIEAFVLQIEGSKMWRVYAPRNQSEKLPRTSSPNFSQDEIGNPILEVLLKAGDLLYFPRGYIHQASTVPGVHSLHVTVSTYQKNSWADFMEKLVPAALASAIEEDEEFRKGMPLNGMQHIGVAHCESQSAERGAIMKKIRKLFSKLADFAPIDAAADQMSKDFIHDALPPVLNSDERKCSVLENSERMRENGKLQGSTALQLQTQIRLTRANALRLVSEEEPDTMKIYHSMENSFEYHGEELQCCEIPVDLAPAVEFLIHSYPKFVPVSEFPLEKDSDKIQIATELWERCLVLTEKPLDVTACVE